MMEWGDYGLKAGEDVLEALAKTGATPHEMHKVMAPVHGTRFTGIMADALELAIRERDALAEALLLLRDGGEIGEICGAWDDAQEALREIQRREGPDAR